MLFCSLVSPWCTISTRTPLTSSKEGEGLPDQCFYMAKGILVCPDFIYLRLVTPPPPPLFSPVSRSFPSLKGVFAKNERRYRLIKLVAIINEFNAILAYISPFIFFALTFPLILSSPSTDPHTLSSFPIFY